MEEDSERSSNLALKILDDLIGIFSKCNFLDFDSSAKDGQTVDRTKISDICGTLPCRGVDVSIRIYCTEYEQSNRRQ